MKLTPVNLAILRLVTSKQVMKSIAQAPARRFLQEQGRSVAASVALLKHDKVQKNNPYHDEQGRFTSATKAKGTPSIDIDQVTAAAKDYMRERRQTEGDKFATVEEYKQMMSDVLDWQEIWQDGVQTQLGVSFNIKNGKLAGVKHISSNLEATRALVEKTVKELGITVPVVVKAHAPTFKLNGRLQQTEGEYDPNTGVVTIYAGISPAILPRLLRHENQHAKFEKATPHIEKTVKAYEKDLAYTDGVTPYSQEWWGAYRKKQSTLMDTVDETLAEIATLSPSQRQKVSPVWKNLYEMVEKHSK